MNISGYERLFRAVRSGETHDSNMKDNLQETSFDRCLSERLKHVSVITREELDERAVRGLIDVIERQINEHMMWLMGSSTGGFDTLQEKVSSYPASGLFRWAASTTQRSGCHENGQAALSRTFNAIKEASRKYEVDEQLIHAVVKAESDYDPKSRSSKGAIGLMQLMPETARELGVRNPYDVHENVMGGTRYLKQLLDRYEGNVNCALAAYNWGMGNLERNPQAMPKETKTYIARIKGYMQNVAV